MRFSTQINEWSLSDLKAMAKGSMLCAVSDIDFLETLARHQCFLVTPWVVRAQPSGGLARVTELVFDLDGNIDKARVLLAMAKEIRHAEQRGSLRRTLFRIIPASTRQRVHRPVNTKPQAPRIPI